MGNTSSTSSSSGHWAKEEEAKIKARLSGNMPPYFSSELFSILRSTSVDVLYEIIRLNSASALYQIYQKATQQYSATLDQFVEWILQSSIPAWYNASGQTFKEDPVGLQSLTSYFLRNYDNDVLDWMKQSIALMDLVQVALDILLSLDPSDLHHKRCRHMAAPALTSPFINAYAYYLLTLHLPSNALSWSESEPMTLEHSRVYSSQEDGMSWEVFVNGLVQKGATLIIIKTKSGDILGGYADDTWEYKRTEWYGNDSNFLFRLTPSQWAVYPATSINNHYQYLCWGKKSLPNGLGMGGQFDYSALWLNTDFTYGHSRAGPLSTTYASPPLSSQDPFVLDDVQVWVMRPLIKDEDTEQNGGVLSHQQDMEFMEMAGKKMYSKDLGPDKPESKLKE